MLRSVVIMFFSTYNAARMTIQEQIQQLSEDDLREKVVRPLMGALGCENAWCEQGSQEFGKDVVYKRNDLYGRPYYGAIVLKAVEIDQSEGVRTVGRQIEEARSVQYRPPSDMMTPVSVQEITVMTSFNFTPNARTAVGEFMTRGVLPRVHVIDGDELAGLIRKVVRRAKDVGLMPESYIFDHETFHEVCERVMQSASGAKNVDSPSVPPPEEGVVS